MLTAAFTVMLISLAGLPLTLGFITMFYLVSAGIPGQLWLPGWALSLGSAVGAYDDLRVIPAMLASAPAASSPAVAAAPSMPLVPVLVVALIGVALLPLGV